MLKNAKRRILIEDSQSVHGFEDFAVYLPRMSVYKIDIEGQESIELSDLMANSLKLNGKSIDLNQVKTAENQYHIIHNNKSFTVDVLDVNLAEKSMILRVNNKEIALKAEDQFDLLLHQLGMDQMANAGVSDLKAPMPGLVLDLPVEVGQSVQKDEALVVLEAMKMENVLKSPSELVVKAIRVKKGEAVEKNQVLIEFEQ